MSRPLFSARAGRLSLWLGGAALAFLAFVRITRELMERDVSAGQATGTTNRSSLRFASTARTTLLNEVFRVLV
jgi:hypothetical protein